ncbi:hypothetical protein ARMGADRAFT_1004734 [Armillaria gallica]|uniref:Uncharacterized protein n=1 Tax=Armillaria gallica TaxID=47427 RepID=A0A2H3ECT7_ARMGA|nr:hypothetical protein ARMGADRAFT_1004734 [Armillaria gallica]
MTRKQEEKCTVAVLGCTFLCRLGQCALTPTHETGDMGTISFFLPLQRAAVVCCWQGSSSDPRQSVFRKQGNLRERYWIDVVVSILKPRGQRYRLRG